MQQVVHKIGLLSHGLLLSDQLLLLLLLLPLLRGHALSTLACLALICFHLTTLLLDGSLLLSCTFELFSWPLRSSLNRSVGLLLDRLDLFALRRLSKVPGGLYSSWRNHISSHGSLLSSHTVLLWSIPLNVLLLSVSICRRPVLVVLKLLHSEAHDVLHFVQHF